MNEWVITTAITLGIGVIAYFLKRTMNQVDSQWQEVRKIAANAVAKDDMKEAIEELKKDIREIRDSYTPINVHTKAFDECREDIKLIKSKYLTKDDFIREISTLDRKLDRMLEMMINRQGNGG